MASNKKEYSLGFIIGAQLKSSFAKTFKAVEKQFASAQKAVKNVGKAWADFGKNAAKLVAGVSAAAVGVGTVVWKSVDSIAAAGDRAAKNSAKLSMTSEAYQELEYAFGHAGMGADEFYSAMLKLESKLTEASFSEEKAKEWAEEFGLSAEKLKNMTPEKRIERLADYFNALEDPIVKDKLAMEMFGESGIEMTAILAMGSKGIQDLRKEASDTGNVISNEVAKQAEVYEDAKDRMKNTFNGIKVQLFSGLLPVFINVFSQISDRLQGVDWALWGERIVDWVQEAIPKIQEIATNVGEFIGKIWAGIQVVKDFVGGWDKVGAIIAGLMSMKTAISGVVAAGKTIMLVGKIIGLLFSPLGAIVAAFALAAYVIYKNWDKLRPAFENIMNTLKGAWDRVWPAIQGAIEKLGPLIEKISEIVLSVIEWLLPVIDSAINTIIIAIENIINVVSAVMETISGILQFFIDLFTLNWQNLGEDIAAIWESVKNLFGTAIDAILKIGKGFVDTILKIFAPITEFFQNVGNWISNLFSGKKTMTVEVDASGGLAEGGTEPVPGHATGGIFRRPHLAQIAEGGDPEAVVPINNTLSARRIWEMAGNMAGFYPDDVDPKPRPRSAAALAGQVANPNTAVTEHYEISTPVTVTVSGNADASTVKGLKGAASNIEARVRAAVRSELDAIVRQKARLAY